jgi:CRISPR-associated protein Csx3
MNLLPAVVIGGPPHAGKSVLTFSLSQALRARNVAHYVLRAFPDGEGDWSNQARQDLVRAIRIKGDCTPELIQHICRDIAQRHLPLIVDPGGKPTDWQEAVFDECTHAILLWPDAESRRTWEAMLKRHGLPIVADLRSDLHGTNSLEDNGPISRGTLAGLERGAMAEGLAFEALVERVSGLFSYSLSELRAMHLAQAPVELVIELGRLGRTLDALDGAQEWIPQHLPRVLDYLPSATPLGLYDRGPNWLYAALALYAYPEPLYQFDVRLGWIKPPALQVGQPAKDALLRVRLFPRPDHIRVELALRDSYLDFAEADGLYVPPVPQDIGIVLSGKLPLWLWTSAAVAYRPASWLGIYQPQLHDRAVVVHSRDPHWTVGQLVSSAAAD